MLELAVLAWSLVRPKEVISFHVVLDEHLPVAGYRVSPAFRDYEIGHIEVSEIALDVTQRSGERLTVRVEVDHDVPLPTLDVQREETKLRLVKAFDLIHGGSTQKLPIKPV